MYFEDGCSRPALVNVGIRKGLWSYAERFEAAFRAHSGTGSVRGPWANKRMCHSQIQHLVQAWVMCWLPSSEHVYLSRCASLPDKFA